MTLLSLHIINTTHKSSAACPPTAHLHILHTPLLFTVHPRCAGKDSPWEEHESQDLLHTRILSTHSHNYRAILHYPHFANNNIHILTTSKDSADRHHLTRCVHSPYSVLIRMDAVVYLIPSPCCWRTGFSPRSTAGGNSSNKQGEAALYVHYDMQEIRNATRITSMRDKDNIQELECRKGVSISQ